MSERSRNNFEDIHSVNQQIKICGGIMFVLYTFLLVAAIHNTIRIVLKNERYKSFHMSSFYILVFMDTIFRLIWIALIFTIVVKDEKSPYFFSWDDN